MMFQYPNRKNVNVIRVSHKKVRYLRHVTD